jgi:hypothetical protein
VKSAPSRRTASVRIAAYLFGSSVLLFAASHAGAVPSLVYDNTSGVVVDSKFNPGEFEFGDQVSLGGSNRVVTGFQFAYQLQGGDGNETATVRFYANDGPSGAPGTKLFESTPLSISNTGGVFTAGNLANLGVTVPSSFTWSVLFGHVTGDTAMTGIFNPPTVGSSDPSFYWIRQNDQWTKAGFGSAGPANFFARVTADVSAVPEPSTGLLLAAGLLVLARRRRPAAA